MGSISRQRIRRNLGLDRMSAVLADSSGVIYEPNRKGYVRVRRAAGNGLYAPYIVVRLAANASVQMVPNNPIMLGYDYAGELAVVGADFDGQVSNGFNPYANNPADRNLFGYTNQNGIVTLLSHARQPASMAVVVRGYYKISEYEADEFAGAQTTLSAATTGNHRLAGIFLKQDMTLEVAYSTAQSIVDPLDATDIQECLTGKTRYAIPVAFWRVYGGQTECIDTDLFADGRQFINIGEPQYGWSNPTNFPYTALTSDYYIMVGSSGARTVNLMAASSVPKGFTLVIKDYTGNASTGTITLDAAGSDNIDAAGTATITADYGVTWIVSNGVDKWSVM